uniref:Uncharacterized protein n=1 Tax=Timema shepardi TaxID=629360 RepID=A0A7R9AM20_TIMSH|nr:unnamed protein product [Timema shepardi]
MDESADTVKMVLKSDTGDSVTVCMYPDNAFEAFSNKFHNHLDLPLDCPLKVEDSHFLTKEKDSELLFGDLSPSLGLISSVSDVTDVTFVSTDPETHSITSDNNFVMSPVQQLVYPQDVRSCMKPEVSYDSCSPEWSKVISFRCAVPTCVNTKDTWPRKKFFKFPIAKDRCHQWLQLCRREDLLEEPSEMVGSLYVVCSDHFIQDHFVTVARKALTKMAVPTIFPASDNILAKQSVNTKGSENESIHSEEREEDDIVDDDVFYVCDSDTGDLGELTGLERSSSSSDSETDLDSLSQLCRLCGCVSEDAAYIYGSTEEDLGLATKINTLLPIIVSFASLEVEKSDPLPKQVCMDCLSKLDTCFELTKSCLRTDRWLNRLRRKKLFRSHTLMKVHPGEVSQKSNNGFIKLEVTNSTSLCEQTNNSTDVKKKYDEDDFNNSAIEKLVTSCYSCPFCSYGTMIMQKTSSHDSTLVCGDIKTTEQSINSSDLPNDKSAKQMLNKDSVSTSNTEIHPELPNLFYEVRDEHGNKYAMVEPTPSWWNEDGNMGNTEIIIHAVNPNKLSEEPWSTLNHADESVDRHCCLLCGNSFQTLELCLEHSNSHLDTEGFVCNMCLLHFSNKSELTNHMDDHRADEKRLLRVEGSKRLICTVCGRKFNNERTWKAHSCASEPSKKLFKCTECNKSFLTEERLTFHGILHKLKQPNHCEKCDRQFEHRSAFYQHWRLVHEGERPFCCHKCGKTFYSHSRLVTHLRTHSGERPYECDVCHHKFYDNETLKGHYVTHMNTKPFQCHLCGAFCGRRSLFNQHLKVHHSSPNGPKRAPSLIHYFCKSCNKTFTSSNEVLTHRATHWHREEKDKNREDNPVTHDCEYCGNGYLSIAELAKHRKLEHAEEKPYVCSICSESTKTLYEARAHRKSHTTVSSVSEESGGNMKEGDKYASLVCEECGAQCEGSRKLKAHLKLHRAETVYQCGMCCRNFPNHRRLILHQRMHSGEKPYPCPDCERPYRCEYCSKQFRTGQVYYQHRMIHTGERRFPCNVCGKAFKRSHTLVVHKRIHTGEKPNICDVCGKGFRQRTDMRKHRALHGS